MTKHLVVFVITFAIGAVIAVILRTGSHQPYGEHRDHPTSAMSEDHAASEATPTAAPGTTSAAPASASTMHEHAADAVSAAAPVAPGTPGIPVSATVNTICPGCGDVVDPKLPFADYKGKKVGFGCAMCPPKFKADPVKYGEAALKNQVAE